jgi:hypothetical protein
MPLIGQVIRRSHRYIFRLLFLNTMSFAFRSVSNVSSLWHAGTAQVDWAVVSRWIAVGMLQFEFFVHLVNSLTCPRIVGLLAEVPNKFYSVRSPLILAMAKEVFFVFAARSCASSF